MDKVSVGIWVYGSCSDRYVGKGYKPYIDFFSRVQKIAALNGISGIELTFPGDINKENMDSVRKILDEKNLKISALGVELVCDAEWKTGSFSSYDENRRKKSVQLTKEAMDVAKALGIKVVSLWLGQDGFDYVFQANYIDAWKNLVEGIRECADYCPEVKLGIEYKNSEPRMNCYVNSGGKALSLCQTIDRENVGVNLDVGHAFNAGENPAEIAAILMHEKRLFHIHLNDNYRISDDDMPLGSVHWPQYIEFFYWMQKLGYEGWYSLDLYPYRDDPSAACNTSITFIQGIDKLIQEKLIKDEAIQFNRKEAVLTLQELYIKIFQV